MQTQIKFHEATSELHVYIASQYGTMQILYSVLNVACTRAYCSVCALKRLQTESCSSEYPLKTDY